MKKLILLAFIGMLGVALMSNSGGRASVQNAGSTNAPGEGYCQNCHSAGAFNPAIGLEVFEENTSTPVTDYVGGTTYDVKVTITAGNGSPGGFGFQMVALQPGNTSVDSWASPSANAQVASSSATGRQYIEHNGMSSTNEFTGKWTAPIAGTGDITFYFAGIAANGSGSNGGDGTAGGTLVFPESSTSTRLARQLPVQLSIFPNPVQDELTISTIGETSGTHTLNIVDVNGKIVATQQVEWQVGMNYERINVNSLATGTYFLHIQQDDKMVSTTFLKR